MHYRHLVTAVAIFAGLLGATPAITQDAFEAHCVSVTEGDLLVVESNGRRMDVRLAGVDAPELKQTGGEDARTFVVERTYGRTLRVEPQETGSDDTLIARVAVEGQDLGALLVSEGWAWVSPGGAADVEMLEAETAAKAAGKGLWRNPAAVPPWEFRTANSATSPKPQPKRPHTLADVAEDTNLVKNEGEQTVIAGLPVRPYSPPPVPDSAARRERAGGPDGEPAPRPNVISIHEGQGEMPTPRPIIVHNEGGAAGSGAAAAAAASGPGGSAAAAAVVSSGPPAAVDKYWMDENTLNMVFNVACPGGGGGSLKYEVIYNLDGKTNTWQGSKSWGSNATSVTADTVLHGDSIIIDVRVVEVKCS